MGCCGLGFDVLTSEGCATTTTDRSCGRFCSTGWLLLFIREALLSLRALRIWRECDDIGRKKFSLTAGACTGTIHSCA